jgi:outer membrane protein assembly factor BamE
LTVNIRRKSNTAAPPAPRPAARAVWYALAAILLLPAAVATSGCGFVGFPGVYKIDVEQGNLVDQKMIEQLKPGMSRRQVRFIMGSPLVEDTFNPDRWDYPYVIRNGQTIIREAQVSIFFDGDRLVEVRGDYLPEWAQPAEAAADGAGEPKAS